MKNQNLSIVLLSIIFGVIIGYFVGLNSYRPLGMHGAMNEMTIGISGKVGDELDKAFLEEMIIHHNGAIEMAETLLKETKRPELIKLGNDIISAQTGEVQMMKGWLINWFNK